MGRVQNTFFFLASGLQIGTALLVGEAAHRDGLSYGFWMVGAMYLGAAMAAAWPVRQSVDVLKPQRTKPRSRNTVNIRFSSTATPRRVLTEKGRA